MRWLDLPPVWLALCLGLAWASRGILAWGADPLRLVGTGLVALGVALMIAAAWQMARARTTIVPRQDPSALVTSGVFRVSRNPIYLGDALILAGFSLRWDAPLGLILVPGFMALIARRFIAGEEARLSAAFGSAFAAWSATTRRWL